MKRLRRLLLLILTGIAAALGLLTGCQHRLIYFPRPYPEGVTTAFMAAGGQRVTARTSQGNQSAWLMPAASGKPAARLWIVCAGNGSVALDLEPFLRRAGFREDAFLFLDYPGYGDCEGAPTPGRIRDSIRTLVPLAARACGIPETELPTRGLVFGHSLGSACALIAAEESGIRNAVLVSPFTSTMDMAAVMLRAPLGFLVWHRFDNRARLHRLTARGGKAWIFHGTEDEVIPVTMSRQLAAENPASVTLTEIPGGRHNDILQRRGADVIAAMHAARSPGPAPSPPAP